MTSSLSQGPPPSTPPISRRVRWKETSLSESPGSPVRSGIPMASTPWPIPSRPRAPRFPSFAHLRAIGSGQSQVDLDIFFGRGRDILAVETRSRPLFQPSTYTPNVGLGFSNQTTPTQRNPLQPSMMDLDDHRITSISLITGNIYNGSNTLLSWSLTNEMTASDGYSTGWA
jgi:hypothetical protein